MEDALTRIQGHGKAAGILTADQALARRYVEIGATFVGIGSDVGLFVNATSKLISDFRGNAPVPAKGAGQVY